MSDDKLKGYETRRSLGYLKCPITGKRFEYMDLVPDEMLCIESRRRALEEQAAYTRKVLQSCFEFVRNRYGIQLNIPNL